jgi:hypothetical protein
MSTLALDARAAKVWFDKDSMWVPLSYFPLL